MRHIGSLLVAAIFAPSIFLLTGTGLSAFGSALDDDKSYDPLGAAAALGALVVAGVLYAILVMVRLSPLGPGLSGLALWGVSVFALVDIATYKATFAQLPVDMGGSVGEMGLGILLGTPLVATLFSGRRWSRTEPVAFLPRPESTGAEPDPTWVLPAAPVYQSSGAPPVIVPQSAAPPLPKRTPAPPPTVVPASLLNPSGSGEDEVPTQQISAPAVAKTPPDEEPTKPIIR